MFARENGTTDTERRGHEVRTLAIVMTATTLRQLARRQEALRRRLSRVEEDADRLAMDLAQLADSLDATPGAVAADRGLPASRHRTGSQARDALRRTAEGGAMSLTVTRRSDGSADVQIDGGKSFTLPPALADLLSILATSRLGEEDDGFAGWKTIDEIGRLLEKRSSRSFTRHAVTQQVHRLRREIFERGGVNPWLVQTNRQMGARFALRASAVVT